jgi:hypothetical protein
MTLPTIRQLTIRLTPGRPLRERTSHQYEPPTTFVAHSSHSARRDSGASFRKRTPWLTLKPNFASL